MKTQKIGITFSSFDLLHAGHIKMLEEAKTVCDYLIVGKNSQGYHFLLIEFENIYNNITISDGDFGTTIRKGCIFKGIDYCDTLCTALFEAYDF